MAKGTRVLGLSPDWAKFVLAVLGALFFAGGAWALSDYRIGRVEDTTNAQAEKIEKVLERVHQIETTQAAMQVEQRTVAEDVREIKQMIRDMRKPK